MMMMMMMMIEENKVVPVYATKAQKGSRSIAPLILSLGIRS
jgi:energy-converting hydrogenase Eha subunit H